MISRLSNSPWRKAWRTFCGWYSMKLRFMATGFAWPERRDRPGAKERRVVWRSGRGRVGSGAKLRPVGGCGRVDRPARDKVSDLRKRGVASGLMWMFRIHVEVNFTGLPLFAELKKACIHEATMRRLCMCRSDGLRIHPHPAGFPLPGKKA